MAWVANAWTSGIEWRGCSKGDIASSLARRRSRTQALLAPISPGDLEDLTFNLRFQEDANGRTGIRPEDAPRIAALLSSVETRVASLQGAYDRHNNTDDSNYRAVAAYSRASRLAFKLRDVLSTIAA